MKKENLCMNNINKMNIDNLNIDDQEELISTLDYSNYKTVLSKIQLNDENVIILILV